MIVEIDDILQSLSAHKHIGFESKFKLEDIEFADKVKAELRLTNAGSRIIVDGSIKTKIKLNCSRCCEDFIFPVDIHIEEEYLPKNSPQAEGLSEVDLHEAPFFVYGNYEIDLDEAIRQNILTSVDIKPLCKQNCQGICAV